MTQPQHEGPTYIKPIDPIAIARVDVDSVPVEVVGPDPLPVSGTVYVAAPDVLHPLPVEVNGHSATAFGDARVGNLTPQAGWNIAYGINARMVTTTTAGGGTVTADAGRAKLHAAAAGDSAVINTRRALRYIPGVGGLFRATTVWSGLVADWASPKVIGLTGIGDAADGFFVGYYQGVFGFLRRTNGSPAFTPLANFTEDPGLANGSGPTGITWNPAYGHPFQIQYQWLGYGAIILCVEDPMTGHLVRVHTERYAGTSTATSIRNPQLPCRSELTLDAGYAGGALDMYSPSAMAFQEAAVPDSLLVFHWTKARAVAVTTAELPLVSISSQATFGGIVNRVHSTLHNLNICATQNTGSPRSVTVRLYRGTDAVVKAALTNENFVTVNADSCMFADVSATAVNTGTAGLTQIYEYRISVPNDTDIVPPHFVLAPGEAIIATAIANTATADVEIVLGWEEEL